MCGAQYLAAARMAGPVDGWTASRHRPAHPCSATPTDQVRWAARSGLSGDLRASAHRGGVFVTDLLDERDVVSFDALGLVQ